LNPTALCLNSGAIIPAKRRIQPEKWIPDQLIKQRHF
jgi:hypothetical protein